MSTTEPVFNPTAWKIAYGRHLRDVLLERYGTADPATLSEVELEGARTEARRRASAEAGSPPAENLGVDEVVAEFGSTESDGVDLDSARLHIAACELIDAMGLEMSEANYITALEHVSDAHTAATHVAPLDVHLAAGSLLDRLTRDRLDGGADADAYLAEFAAVEREVGIRYSTTKGD